MRFWSHALAILTLTVAIITILTECWVKRLPIALTYDQWISWINVSFFVRVACLIGVIASILVMCLGIVLRKYPHRWFLSIGLVSILLFIGALIMTAPSLRDKYLSLDGWCFFMMRRVELAKDEWTDFHQAPPGLPVAPHVIDTFIGFKATCPAGGHYEYGVIGTAPTCSMHGPLIRRWIYKEPRMDPPKGFQGGVEGVVSNNPAGIK